MDVPLMPTEAQIEYKIPCDPRKVWEFEFRVGELALTLA